MEETPVSTNGDKPEGKDPQWYREAIDKANQEKAEAIQVAKDAVFGSIPGLDPSKGLGKKMVDGYDGEIDRDQFLAWAETEYEWKPPSGDQPPPAPAPAPAAQGVNQVVAEASQRQETVVESTQPLTPPDLDAAIAKAEADGDIARSVALKTQKAINLR